ncbi:MAG: hypothetical protein ACLQGV_00055 [Bryobacteraceae bacterium]
MKNISFWMGVLALMSLAALPASAGVLYNNDFGGVISGDDLDLIAWTIDEGFSVTDSFVLPSNSTVDSINLALWAFPGDTLSTVDWYIQANDSPSDPLSGTIIASGTASPTNTLIGTNEGDYIYEESFDIPVLSLSGGTTYWLQLANAVVPDGDPIYWDQSDGPSTAYESYWGYGMSGNDGGCGGLCTYSESFQLLGTPSGGAVSPSRARCCCWAAL